LPGLFVDRYGDALTLQTLGEGADARKAEWAPVLAKLTGARLLVCRDDASGRDFEGLNANAFDVLRSFSEEGRRSDVVVLGHPGLARRKEGLEAARRAYHELNLRALELVKPDGLMVTGSCSGKVSRATFEDIVLDAAADAKRRVQILERRGAGIDHPPLGALPETEYLKAWFLRVL
jgi:23S rRNA G2069 N7-methylase RlmK/C1962 C5-methylase RlmI